MANITIREVEAAGNQPPAAFQAVVSIDHGPEYHTAVQNPFSQEQEAELAWYFEEHLTFPFTHQVRAQTAARSIQEYGQNLFQQVFSTPALLQQYGRLTARGVANLDFEIAGSPDFHALHWEALKDPALPRPFALEASFVRKNLQPRPIEAELQPSPTLNILVVTARPGGRGDVGYRTISRPLVESLPQAGFPVRIDLLRPSTYPALVRHLENARDLHGPGYYHVIHFDVHGALLPYEAYQKAVEDNRFLFQARYGRDDIEPYDDLKAFLFLDGTPERPYDPLEANELADLLTAHQIPIVLLNACQSGKQVGERETSLAAYLMRAGVQVALGMSYSITVSAAELLMGTVYQELFQGRGLPNALRRARLELHNQKGRRAYFDQTIDLEDWLLPVVYQNQPVQVQTRPFTPEENQAYYTRQAQRVPYPEPAYGFFGRDLDVLEIEKRLLREADGRARNLLLVRGMGGVGKTTLLRHLGAWWQHTGCVDRVFYFGYDEKAHTRQQILHSLAQGLLGKAQYHAEFTPLAPEAAQEFIAARLRSTRHLLILDNLESITGAHLAVQNILPEPERMALKSFLACLSGGLTLVLLGSRGGEAWLTERQGAFSPPLQADDAYELAGLDPEAASGLANSILARQGAGRYTGDPDLARLLELLGGVPLALEVTLANLKRRPPGEVLAALQAGLPEIDSPATPGQPLTVTKTESLLHCIEYSHAGLSPEAQTLLACLAPFTGVVDTRFLSQYTAKLQAQPALAGLPFERWAEVLQEATDWGLLSPHAQIPAYLRLQPALPYFLRQRLADPGQAEVKAAIETAFRLHYDNLGKALRNLLGSKEPDERQLGQAFLPLENENLRTALDLALQAHASILNPYVALSGYLDAVQDHPRGLALGEHVLSRLQTYPTESLSGPLGAEFVGVLDNIAKRQLSLKQHPTAAKTYQMALDIHNGLTIFDEKQKGILCAGIYHQLGMVAEEQRQWAQAEGHYQQALALFIEFNDRYEQAGTYHQLGRVAEEQRQWAQAKEYFLQALEIGVDYQDEYRIATRLQSLARLWQSSGDASLPAAVANLLKLSEAEALQLLQSILDKQDRPQEP